MRRFFAITLSSCLLACLFLGCSKKPVMEDVDKQAKVEPPKVQVEQPKKNAKTPKDKVLSADKQEKYNAALDDAIPLLAARKWAEALKAFEKARDIDDTEFVQTEIARLKHTIARNADAKSTVQSIETVLNDGNPEDAGKLANEALKDFGDGDAAAKLVQLSVQADALQSVEKKEDDDARFKRFRKIYTDSMADKNCRAALLAAELALQVRDDADLKAKHQELYDKLDTYDALRKKAAELRRDATKLDDALAALQDAARAWDTPQIQNEISECQLALQKRRETVSVANFEVRNDVGMADAGAALADELLPQFKAKYDLVERNQLRRVAAELKLQAGFADDPVQQKQLGNLAKVRYLVAGSIGRRAGVTVLARLIDLQTGLVVQTAKISAATMEDAITQAPELAKQLMMTDDEKMKFDAVAQNAKPAPVVPDNAVVPAADAPAVAPVNVNVAPPAVANMKRDAFKVLAPAPADFVAPAVQPLAPQPANRLLVATVEMGDALFAAGRFADAQRQFAFALALAPGNVDIQIRLNRVLPLVPPIDPQPPFLALPRVVVLPFMTVGNVPPALSYWTPTNLAPYFASRYQVVDPGELYWYMGRMGLSMQDVVNNPNARRWLGRAAGVRYFVFGSCIETTSFDVNTYLIDAEFGYLQGQGRINVRDPFELKFRLGELAYQTMLTPVERAVLEAQLLQQRYADFVADGRRLMDQRRYALAANEFAKALQVYSGDVQVRIWFNECQALARFQNIIDDNQRQFLARRSAMEAQRQRQAQLARQAQDARRRAAVAEAGRTDAERRTRVNFRFQARDAMVARAKVSLKTDRVGLSVALFQGALDIGATARAVPGVTVPPMPPAVHQDFAKARLQAEVRDAKLTAASETALRQMRDQQLADAQKQLAIDKTVGRAKLDAVRTAQVKRDDDAYKAGIKQGQAFMSQNKFEAALAAFQGAQRVANTPDQNQKVNGYIDIIVQRQAESLGKTDQERKQIAARLDAERDKRKTAEDRYKVALQAGQKALADKNLDTAQAKFEEARQLFKTDAVLNGLQQVQAARISAKVDPKLVPKLDPNKSNLQDLIAAGQSALKLKDYDAAEKSLRAASLVEPKNAAVVQGLKAVADGRKALATAQATADYQTALGTGQKALQGKKYDDAIRSFRQALKLMPNDPSATKLLQQAENAQTLAGKSAAANFQQGMLAFETGKKALAGKNYPTAIKAFTAALAKLDPNDVRAQKAIEQAEAGITDARAQITVIQTNYQKAMTAGETSMTAKKYPDAVGHFKDALRWIPGEQKATLRLQSAQRALQDSTKPPPPPDANKQFNDVMQKAATAAKAKKYAEAVKGYAQALKLRTKDADALAGWRENQFELHLWQGQQYLNNAMWMGAQFEFEAALRIFPNNDQAKKLLQKAKSKMK